MAGNLTAMIAAAFSGGAAPPVTTDPYYEYTTLLLPGNGTNGAQNNTFLDGSTNNFTITRNGNTTQGTFSPFSQTGWSNYFDGTGDYLSIANASALQIANTGSWTIECLFYATRTTSNFLVSGYKNGAPYNGFGLTYGRDAVANILEFWDGTTWRTIATGVSANQWHHVAVVQENGVGSTYLDGVRQTTSLSFASTINNTTSPVGIGANSDGVIQPMQGYISNVRIVKGSAVYSGATYTVPTSPLTAITNTSLLTCQSNRFIDNSTNNFTITRNGDTSVVAFSPFNPTASWSAATNGGSGYFDGSGDYLSLADNAAFAMGTGNFTAEFWIYTQDQTNLYPGVISASIYNDTGAANIRYDNTGHANKIFVYLYGASPFNPAITSSTYAFGQWIHVALIRDSSTSLKLYVNGTIDGSLTISSGQEVDFSGANSFYVGRGLDTDGSNGYYAGYISGVRLVKGQALASGNFTPPSTPVTSSSVGWTGANAAASITGTVSFVSSFTNAGIYDATSRNDLETVGNAQISTTQSKWGGSSIAFDGTGDYLITNVSTADLYSFGTGDWTVEFWVRFNNTTGDGCIFDTRNATDTLNVSILRSTTTIIFQTGGATRITSGTITSNVWYHVALARSGTSTKMFIDGTQAGSTYTDTTSYTAGANRPIVGAVSLSGFVGISALNGYVNDLRVTKGYARYTTNFTPPTAAFPTL